MLSSWRQEAPASIGGGTFTDYDKVLDGYNVAKNIGLEKMRENCRHFDEWVSELEKIV